jgi:hypothetical protein
VSLAVPEIEVDDAFAEIGGVFNGRVFLPGAEGLDPQASRIREVRVTLKYWTEGRGDTDSWQSDPRVYNVAVDGSLAARFSLAVPPAGPISYDGSLMRVMWAIEARTDLKMRIDKKNQLPVVVVPAGGTGLYRHPHPLYQ